MVVNRRPRQVQPADDQAIEAFANRAEQETQSAPQTDQPAWKVRNKEPKVAGINFRMSTTQSELLRRAAEMEEVSQQKLLQQLVWPVLEEKYGAGSNT